MYTIGQVSERFDLPVSTLRYYDKEGLFPALTRTSGIRRFGEQELEALRVIECLKRSGLEIKEIKQFMDWCAQGSETYPQRHALFVQQAERVEAEIERLQKSLDMIRFKCWYYEQAMRDGSEDRVHAMLPDHLPPDIQPVYDHAHTLERVKTANMGTLYELQYRVTLRDAQVPKAFLDALRCRNGNLNITCSRELTGEAL